MHPRSRVSRTRDSHGGSTCCADCCRGFDGWSFGFCGLITGWRLSPHHVRNCPPFCPRDVDTAQTAAPPPGARGAGLKSRGVTDLSREYNCDSTTIRRYHDAFDYDRSDRNYDSTAIRLRLYDKTTTNNWHVNFLLASNRVEWKQARSIRRSRIVAVS